MTRSRQVLFFFLLCVVVSSFAQDTTTPRTYLVKLGVSVSAKDSKPGDRIRAAIVSPEILLNGYLEGTVEKASRKPNGTLVLRFDNLTYKGKTTPIESVVVDWVNSKGHKDVDDEERPIRLENGAFVSNGPKLWLDEGSELRVKVNPKTGQ